MNERDPIANRVRRQSIRLFAIAHGRGLAALFYDVTLEDVDRLVAKRRGRRDTPPPTPEEIAERSAEIRAGWDDATRAERQVSAQAVAWNVPYAGDAIDESEAQELVEV